MQGGWVYIMTNQPFGPLYVGVTNDIQRRVGEHKLGTGSRFTAKYGLKRLVHVERYEDILTAIQREKNIIVDTNPLWEDLSANFFG